MNPQERPPGSPSAERKMREIRVGRGVILETAELEKIAEFGAVQEKGKSLAEQVADRISEMIKEQTLTQGQKLPNEFELAGLLNVGRGTVREAVKLLVSRNVLEIQRGRGTYVNRFPGVVDDPLGFNYMKDKYRLAQDLLEMRMLLEPQIAELAAVRATEEDIKEITRLCDEVEMMIREGVPHLTKDVEFHGRIASSTRNQVMPNIIPIITKGVSYFVEMTNYSLDKETIETHRQITNAIAAHDPLAAKAAMSQHLIYNRDRMKKYGNPEEERQE